ncbi:hypothetical protein BsWGS_28255 [Bradybaena similaris]
MPKSQQLASVAQNQLGTCHEKDEVALLRNNPPKPIISRSNSAPQAHYRSASGKQNKASHMAPSSKLSPSRKKKIHEEERNIPTLSDGVILVSQQQTAACVVSSHEHLARQGLSNHTPHSAAALSSTPLCDTNHSPFSIKHYYEKTSPVFGQDVKPGDVWQRREHSEATSQVDYKAFDNNQNMPGYQPVGYKTASTLDSDSHSPHINGAKEGLGPGASFRLASDQAVANGDHLRENGIECCSQVVTSDNNGGQSPSNDLDSDWTEADLRKQPRRYPTRQAQSELILPSEVQRRMTLVNVKEKGYARLLAELMKAQKELELKDEEVDELRGIRERLMKEVSDFTASLFEEVNSQLNEAALSEQLARKQLKEANEKIEVLSAEVTALKNLVLTSTPSSPNKHLHPQIDNSSKKDKGGKPFWKTHRRSTSHHQLTKESQEKAEADEHHSLLKELDTTAFEEFKRWCLQPTTEFIGQYFARVQQEDIQPCLNFRNTRLADKVLEGVRNNSLSIEPIPGDQSYPRKCCLSESHKLCNYKIKFEGDDEWYSISQMSRNRIAAVCDFYAYLRYIVQGLVKCSEKDMFAELIRIRIQMAQARLGLI